MDRMVIRNFFLQQRLEPWHSYVKSRGPRVLQLKRSSDALAFLGFWLRLVFGRVTSPNAVVCGLGDEARWNDLSFLGQLRGGQLLCERPSRRQAAASSCSLASASTSSSSSAPYTSGCSRKQFCMFLHIHTKQLKASLNCSPQGPLLIESTLLASLLFQILRRSSKSTIFRLWYRSICGSLADSVYDVGCSGGNLLCIGLCVGLDLGLEGVTFRCYCIEIAMLAQLRPSCAYRIAPRQRHCWCCSSRPEHRPKSISRPSSSSFVTSHAEKDRGQRELEQLGVVAIAAKMMETLPTKAHRPLSPDVRAQPCG
ncbi:hypothetical protein KCU74_g112, partial [Aureobasidium melanogenum]